MSTLGRPGWRGPVAAALLALCASAAHADSVKAARYYEDALKRFERQDIDGAVIQLKNALQQDARMLTVHVLLGKALLMRSEAAAAEIEFNEALSQGINRAEVAVPLAQALVAQGKQPEVFKLPALVPDGLPDHIRKPLLLVRAAAASDLGDPVRAQAQIDLARAIPPENADTWLAEVPLRLRARQFDKAAAAADQALRLAPGNGEALYQRASVPHVQGRLDEALKGYERAIAADPRHLEAQLARAGLLIDLNRDADALAQVQSALKLAPSEPRALYLTAVLAERRGDAAAAKAALKAVTTELDPVPIEFIRFRPQALMLNGLAHFGLGEMEKAKPYLEYAQRQTPNSPLSKLLAQVYVAEPNLDRAGEVLEAYVKAYPGDGQALVMLATLQMAQGRHARAATLMQEALKTRDAPEFRTALGLSLLRSGQSGDAIGELEKSFQRDPRQTYAGMALMSLYLRGGQPAKAVAIGEKLVKQAPSNPTTWIQLGVARKATGNLAGAREAYQKAAQLDAALPEAQLGLARVDITERKFDDAQARLAAMLKADEKNADALYEMALLSEARGQAAEVPRWLAKATDVSTGRNTRADQALVAWLLKQDQPGPALEAAKKLLGKAPDDPQTLITYARAQLANRDVNGARATLTNAARRSGFGADPLAQIAGLQLDARDLAGAAYSLDKALQTAPQHVGALALSSTVATQQGNLVLAEKQARQVIQLRPQAALGYSLLADVAQARKQPAQALEALRKAHEVQPTSGSLLALMRALGRQDPAGKAAPELAERWLKTRPNDLAAWKALGDAQARAGVYPAARRSYETALKLKADDVDALNNLANTLVRQGDPAAATAVAERALALEPRNVAVIDTAGWAFHLAGNADRALQLLRDARLREPNSPDIRFHLAAALAKAGRKAEAREELDVALRSTAFESHKEALALSQTLR
ncbi:XrtA/PEP-CTERM system TPR-repeat protein PrsT [Mitsuaria sp. GD03876]|uniref:XrtA/PEP-CTERM system TPR-repeat protein PrsT n=1 Tax=Mitsuaria sp. GD03876 TaxID=2975399 RepID=UPI002449F370|nr:XrtA/PEP-CTERM system TPR-repeat protein PrsT [Mitsuaria sp. GD03876]MDH0868113.1 PEP-CTERM system TPR-repeat protein PrsT [Mitsuaria sp. GD03876]